MTKASIDMPYQNWAFLIWYIAMVTAVVKALANAKRVDLKELKFTVLHYYIIINRSKWEIMGYSK